MAQITETEEMETVVEALGVVAGTAPESLPLPYHEFDITANYQQVSVDPLQGLRLSGPLSDAQLKSFVDGLSPRQLQKLIALAERALDATKPSSAAGQAALMEAVFAVGGTGKSAVFVPVVTTERTIEGAWDLGDSGTAVLDAPAAETAVEEAPSDEAEAPPAYQAFKDIGDWLDAPDGEVADAVGIGRTTPYSWLRDKREPRRGTAQRIYEVHATLSALRRRLGPAGLRTWLYTGEPNPRALILSGDLEAVEGRVHDVLFRRQDTGIDLAWEAEPETPTPEGENEESDLGTSRPPGRRMRRARAR